MFKKLLDYGKHKPLGRYLSAAIPAVLLFVLYTVLVAESDRAMAFRGVMLLFVYLVGLALCFLLLRHRGKHLEEEADAAYAPDRGVALNVLTDVHFPVVITDADGHVVWYNKSFTAAMQTKGVLYGHTLDELCGADCAALISEKGPEGTELRGERGVWNVRTYPLHSQNRSFYAVYFEDRTEADQLSQKLVEGNIVVAYIVVDNLDDLMQYVQEKQRAVSDEVAAVLREWAAPTGGLLKEYDHDHYLFLFQAKYLAGFAAANYDVLDRVRALRIGEGNLPVTISIGISDTVGTLEDKSRTARASLDMALRRGGDQVVLRGENGLEFFGGFSQSVRTKTKVRARVIAYMLADWISGSSTVLIMGHRNADFDALGACIGLARFCMYCGVPVHIVCRQEDPNLAGCFEKIGRLPEYRDLFIDAVRGQELLDSHSLLLIADVNNPEQYESAELADAAPRTFLIDHHRKHSDTMTRDRESYLEYIEPAASSTCELVAEILEQAIPAGNLCREEADIMLAGILLDTKRFSHNTDTRTFGMALYLRGEGADPGEAERLFRTNLDDLMREARFEAAVKMYHENLAVMCCESSGSDAADRIAAAKAADRLLTVKGVEASFALVRIDADVFISARSSGTVNVQLILESIGGGGHFDAAGARLTDLSLEEAEQTLTEAIDDYFAQQK